MPAQKAPSSAAFGSAIVAAYPMRALAIGSVLTVVSAAVLVLAVALWSATEADNVTKRRLFQIVGYALETNTKKISYDQESVAYWDEAVTNTRHDFNEEWVDVNLGVWMHDYFNHDRVVVLDEANRPRYAMVDGKKAPISAWTSSEVITRLAAQLRDRIASGALAAYEAGKMRIPRAEDLGFVEGRPAIVSVMVLVPHTSSVTQERGSEYLTVNVRFLDGNFLKHLEDTYLLEGLRFSRSAPVSSLEQSYPLTSNAGTVLGSIIWAPDLPGRSILGKVLPVMAAGLACIGLAIWFLIRRLRRAYTELVSSEAQAKHLAFHDTLTGLANRAYFNERLELALCEVRDGREQLALMFLDLDRFKQVNDSLGHAAGDALIRALAMKLKGHLKPGDTLARIGGDEFAVVMRNVRGRHEVEALCRDIVAAATAPFDILGGQVRVGISIGVAVAPAAGLDRSELARKADIALYQAKRCGGLGFQFFSEDMSHAVQQRRELETALGRALASGSDLDVVFQPLFCADRIVMTGVEALLRWQHPRLGPVSPYTFIGIAEDCGLINPLGEFVLRRACTLARAWDIDRVAVNVSPIQLRQPDFAERVLVLLGEIDMHPGRLEIEITESSLIGGSDITTHNLTTLRSAGAKIAVDDFGTGYSSLSYLMRLEVDRIKIDRSFVHAIGESTQSNSIIQAIVTMAHAVGVSVTAEGVETLQQQEFLIAVGCDDLQGNLLHQPAPALKIVELLAAKGAAPKPSDTEAA